MHGNCSINSRNIGMPKSTKCCEDRLNFAKLGRCRSHVAKFGRTGHWFVHASAIVYPSLEESFAQVGPHSSNFGRTLLALAMTALRVAYTFRVFLGRSSRGPARGEQVFEALQSISSPPQAICKLHGVRVKIEAGESKCIGRCRLAQVAHAARRSSAAGSLDKLGRGRSASEDVGSIRQAHRHATAVVVARCRWGGSDASAEGRQLADALLRRGSVKVPDGTRSQLGRMRSNTQMSNRSRRRFRCSRSVGEGPIGHNSNRTKPMHKLCAELDAAGPSHVSRRNGVALSFGVSTSRDFSSVASSTMLLFCLTATGFQDIACGHVHACAHAIL